MPHAESTLTFDEGYPPLAPGPGNERLLALYDQASRDVGAGPVGPVNPDRAGAADVSFAAGHVKMVLDGIGLMGHSDHTPQETADLATLPSQTKRAALLLHRLGQGARRAIIPHLPASERVSEPRERSGASGPPRASVQGGPAGRSPPERKREPS